MALYFAIFMGGTPIGAPLVGWVANSFGPRWSLGGAAASGLITAVVGFVWAWRAHHLRIHYDRTLPRRLHMTTNETKQDPEPA